jgi:hypothetical protein
MKINNGELDLINSDGRIEVMTLVNGTKETENYTVEYIGSNLASGAYFYKIESGMFTSIKRMILIK